MRINYKVAKIEKYGKDWPVGVKLRVVKFTDDSDKKYLTREGINIGSEVTLSNRATKNFQYNELLVKIEEVSDINLSATTFELYEDKL